MIEHISLALSGRYPRIGLNLNPTPISDVIGATLLTLDCLEDVGCWVVCDATPKASPYLNLIPEGTCVASRPKEIVWDGNNFVMASGATFEFFVGLSTVEPPKFIIIINGVEQDLGWVAQMDESRVVFILPYTPSGSMKEMVGPVIEFG